MRLFAVTLRQVRPAFVTVLILIVSPIEVRAVREAAANGREAAAETRPSTSPAVRGQTLVRDFGAVGDAVRRSAKEKGSYPDWLARLSTDERERVLADLNTWSFRIEDRVEAKSVAPDGTTTAWRFVSEDDPKIVVAASGKAVTVGRLGGKVAASELKLTPPDQDDVKTSYWNLSWETPTGHDVPLGPLVKGFAFWIRGASEVSARPGAGRRPTTVPAKQPG
jgi:hypothetical protein